ncbi:unnamed protein product [Phytophthora fragariaefolia]|uniref:Unnamed protein product n=1 Tax=Phytophthora fragariaefolia TaxID=1490495 RepID=A0A9W6WQE9_9STRA|nr:unnamed protein product [Phytophthora fragariaefolia]
MSSSYADTVKLVEDNYFHGEFNMRMKLSRKGLLAHIIKPEFDTLSDRSKVQWKTDDLKALGVIAGDVSLTYQVYIRGATTAADSCACLRSGSAGTRSRTDSSSPRSYTTSRWSPPLDETRQLVLQLGSLTDEYRMISTVLENTPNMTLAYAIQALSGVETPDESSSGQQKAVVAKKSYDKRRFNGKCFYCNSHMTSVRDKFVSMKELKTPVRITIADGRKIDAVAMDTVGLKLMDGTFVKLADVLYISEVEGSLNSVAKLAEKDVVAQLSKDKCVFRYGDATVMEAWRCGNVYKLKTVGDRVWRTATTSRKEPWVLVHARLDHIPFKRYEQLLTMADGVPRIPEGVASDDICTGCCMGKMRADDYPRYPEKLVKSARVLDLVHRDVLGPMQTRTPGGCPFGVTFIDDYSRHVTVYFMKAKSEVLSKFKIYKAAMENATGTTIKRLRSDNGGGYTDKLFKACLNRNGIKHEKTVSYTPQQNGLAERMYWSLVEMARCMLYHECIDKKWWAESVNTAAWIINQIPNSVNFKTPYEIVNKAKSQLKHLKVFGSLGYAHIPNEMRRNLDAKAFRCQDNEGAAMEPSHGGQQPWEQKQMIPTVVTSCDVISLQRDAGVNGAIVPYESAHPMTTRSRSRPIEETTDPEEAGARKKQVVASSTTGTTKRQRMVQDRAQAEDDQLTIQGGQAMTATEDVPKTHQEATASADHDEWKNAMKSELNSLVANKTWKLVPRPSHQRPIGCRWVFVLKRNEKGQVVRHKARLVAKGYSQRQCVDYEKTYSPITYLNAIRTMLAKCGADGMEIE